MRRKPIPNVLEIIRQRGYFTVSLRWRDDALRARCLTLAKQGKLKKLPKIHNGHYVFVLPIPAEAARQQEKYRRYIARRTCDICGKVLRTPNGVEWHKKKVHITEK